MAASRGVWTPARAGALVVGLAICLAAPSSRADDPVEPAEPIEIGYAAGERCPSKEQFIAIVRRHTTKWKLAEAESGARSFRVRLAPRGQSAFGTLVVVNAGSRTKTREIVGPDCDAVARALAVITALAIDPQAELAEAPAEAPRDATTQTDVANEPASQPGPTPLPPPPKEDRSPGPSPPLVGSPRRASRWMFIIEARAELTSAVIADPLPVLGAAIGARVAPASWPSWLAPSLALGIRQSLPNEVRGASDFLWTAATIRLCPVRISALAARLEFAPCVEAALGVLRADAHGITDARSTSRTWFDRGAGLRAALRIHEAWSVGATASLVAPVTRHRFAIATGELISQAPSIGVAGGLFCELRL